MSYKKRPEVADWDKCVSVWSTSNHAKKLLLAATWGVAYDTAKHWMSEAGSTRKRVNESLSLTIPDICNLRPAVQLDFVSFDLETSNLEADFSIILSAVIKPFGQEPIVFRADEYPEWGTQRANDCGITKAISDELRKHAVVITHYGLYFDTPYLRFKMVKHNLPPLPPMFAIDSWTIAKKNFKMSSRRLGALAEAFDIGEKSGVKGALWMEAAYSGDKEALDKIVAHNIVDCRLLESLACLTFPYLKGIPKL